MRDPSENDGASVRVGDSVDEELNPSVRVIGPDGKWIPATDEVEPVVLEGSGSEAEAEAEEDEESRKRTEAIIDVLAGNAKSVVKAVKVATSSEVLVLTLKIECADKNRLTVTQAINKRLNELDEATKPLDREETPDTQIDDEASARTKAIIALLDQNVKSVADAVRSAQPDDVEVLVETLELEKAGKNRTTVLKAVEKRLAELNEEAKPKEPEIFVRGNIKEILGSFWEDDVGNIFVLDQKMGQSVGIFELRLTKRAGS